MSSVIDATRKPLIVRRPGADGLTHAVRELWQYRDLVFFFALRDIAVRYKQTIVGVAWALIQPLFSTLVFTVVFGYFAKLPSENQPYAVYSLCGVVVWMAFATTLSGATMSVVGEQGIIQKVYYPKLASLVAVTGVALIDNAVQWLLIGAMLVAFGIVPPWTIVLAPLFIVWAALCGVAVGTWLAPINVRYRDVRYAVPFLLQVWMFASPVAYSMEVVPERWRFLYALNPIVPAIEGFRWAILGVGTIRGPVLAWSAAVVIALLVAGVWYFKQMEATFADEI